MKPEINDMIDWLRPTTLAVGVVLVAMTASAYTPKSFKERKGN